MNTQDLTFRWAQQGFVAGIALLVGFGTLMVFSSTGFSHGLTLQLGYLTKHLCFLATGVLLFAVVVQLPTRLIFRLAPWAFVVGMILLVLVLMPGVGSKINGARRWFRVGPVSLQPAEFIKILLPLFLAWWSRGQIRQSIGRQFVALLAIIITPLLIALQPDLGTGLLVFGMGACYLFLSGWPVHVFIIGLLSVLPALGYLMLYRPYQLARIEAYLAALGHWDQAQYQVKQSLLSFGSGGLWGTGPGLGLQKLSFLPESHTDFVFAVIGEEFGLVGAAAVIGIWLAVLVSGTRLVGAIQHDRQRFALAGTLLLGVVFQALINSCVVTSLLPPKGISHPLLSYGGSNLLATLLSLALIFNLTKTVPVDPVINSE